MGDVRNDRDSTVTRFCLAMEEHRRTDAGRVRTAREMLDFYFPRSGNAAEDRIFVHLPPPVRGPIASGWGIRGAKSALRDTDDKFRLVVQDALAAGDIDEVAFETGIGPAVLVDWAPLPEWWTFWRTGKLTGVAIQKALAMARELGLFDDRWFLLNIEGRGGKLKGTDTLSDTLPKDQVAAWIRKIHESGDGSPAGIVAALGWETVLTKTAQDALLFALDALARKIGLTPGVEPETVTSIPAARTDDHAVPDIPVHPAPELDGEEQGPDSNAQAWPDVSSKHAPPPSEPPPSFQTVEEDRVKVPPPPPVPTARKRV